MTEPLSVELFAGIGGMALASHWAGFRHVALVENDEFCQSVLRRNFGSDVEIHGDVTTFDGTRYAGTGIALVSGGFPCQDISLSGEGAGLVEGERSKLWFEMLRIIGEIRPCFVLAENVAALRTRGADIVLDGLEEIGYNCTAVVVGSENVGAPHRRKRAFIVAERRDVGHACGSRLPRIPRRGTGPLAPDGHPRDEARSLADAVEVGLEGGQGEQELSLIHI